jgi:hypothetical protein
MSRIGNRRERVGEADMVEEVVAEVVILLHLRDADTVLLLIPRQLEEVMEVEDTKIPADQFIMLLPHTGVTVEVPVVMEGTALDMASVVLARTTAQLRMVDMGATEAARLISHLTQLVSSIPPACLTTVSI